MLANRYDFVLLFDVQDGNPNGDPDAGNLPRMDPETGHGLVTDVCLKRKLRNYVQLRKGEEQGYDIFVKEKAILNNLIMEPHKEERVKTAKDPNDEARKRMCERFFDVRAFGAVMSTGDTAEQEAPEEGKKAGKKKKRLHAGQVRGPVQLTFARSIDPVVALEHSITRMAVATEREAEEQGGENRTMGRKATIPYALYRSHGFVSASLAGQSGFGDDDLALLWDGLVNMFEHDRSAARGFMNTRKLVVFKHESVLGNAPAFTLFDTVAVDRLDPGSPPRSFDAYSVRVPSAESLPRGVTMELRP